VGNCTPFDSFVCSPLLVSGLGFVDSDKKRTARERQGGLENCGTAFSPFLLASFLDQGEGE
jgi:hypothetical protein